MTTNLFVNAAELVLETGEYSCQAIFLRVGHGFSTAAFYYRRTFTPPKVGGWWLGPDTPANREARVYALLLAHQMHLSGDL